MPGERVVSCEFSNIGYLRPLIDRGLSYPVTRQLRKPIKGNMSSKNESKSAPAKKSPAAAAKAKDLKPKKDAKGGGLGTNHNETLVRDAAR